MNTDRASVPLETEPLVFFHPLLAGSAAPGGVQPLRGHLSLEEEPATWPQFTPGASVADGARELSAAG